MDLSNCRKVFVPHEMPRWWVYTSAALIALAIFVGALWLTGCAGHKSVKPQLHTIGPVVDTGQSTTIAGMVVWQAPKCKPSEHLAYVPCSPKQPARPDCVEKVCVANDPPKCPEQQ